MYQAKGTNFKMLSSRYFIDLTGLMVDTNTCILYTYTFFIHQEDVQ